MNMLPLYAIAPLFGCLLSCGDQSSFAPPSTPRPWYEEDDLGCDGPDVDDDGWCSATDCDDSDPSINPGTLDICDGVDNDCDGDIDEAAALSVWYPDSDGDGYGRVQGAISACEAPEGYTLETGDCNDSSADVHPEADEVCDDGVDNDCTGGDASCD